MKLQIMSDAHMQVDCGFGREYGKFDFPAVAPNLVLLGGMGRICDTELQDFIVLQLTQFERVFYVMGMDEFHQSTVPIGRQQMQEFAENLIKSPPTKLSSGKPINKIGTFHYLHRTRVDIEDVTILGCTLWRGGKSNYTRAEAGGSYRPIKDFFTEEETIERDLDLAWLQSQLEACANGDAAFAVTREGESVAEPLGQPSVDTTAMSTDEGDIYDDIEASLPIETVGLLGAQSSENAPPANQPPLDPPEPTISSPSKRQGPPRRVIIFTAHPPTSKGTRVPGYGPAMEDQANKAAVILQGRQCWALDNGYDNGVVVSSQLHGSNDPRPPAGDSMLVETEQLDTKMSETLSCGHDNGFTGDPFRPPGVALWAFGYTEWSCDAVYEAPVSMYMPPAGDPKGKKPEAPEQSADERKRCSQCNRVLVPIRLVSNQRGQQWKRKLVPYVDVPPTWRAFDEAFMVDV